jgi:hypothetical protein
MASVLRPFRNLYSPFLGWNVIFTYVVFVCFRTITFFEHEVVFSLDQNWNLFIFTNKLNSFIMIERIDLFGFSFSCYFVVAFVLLFETGSLCAALKLKILLHLPPKFWDYRHVPPCPTNSTYSCMFMTFIPFLVFLVVLGLGGHSIP